MKTRPALTVCATITADGKLAAVQADLQDFDPGPGDVALTLTEGDDPVQSLRSLPARADTRRVFCLGDPAMFRRLFDENLVAEIRLLVRPTIAGQRSAATLSGLPGEYFPASIRCRLTKMTPRGDGCFLCYRVLN